MNTQIFDQICQKTSCDLTSVNVEYTSEQVTSITFNLGAIQNVDATVDVPIEFDFNLPFDSKAVNVYFRKYGFAQQIDAAPPNTYPYNLVDVTGIGSGGIPEEYSQQLFINEINMDTSAYVMKFFVTGNYQEATRLFTNTAEIYPCSTGSTLFPYGTGTNVENNADRVLFYPNNISASASTWPNARPQTQIGLTYNQFPSPSYNQHCLCGLVETYRTGSQTSIQTCYVIGPVPLPIVLQSLHLSGPNMLKLRMLPLFTGNNARVFDFSCSMTVHKVL